MNIFILEDNFLQQTRIENIVKKIGSIIFVVGKSPMDIMEPFYCRKKVP